MKWLKRLIKRYVKNDWWRVVYCGWPYREGYATYNERRSTFADQGLILKEDARQRCDILNAEALKCKN